MLTAYNVNSQPHFFHLYEKEDFFICDARVRHYTDKRKINIKPCKANPYTEPSYYEHTFLDQAHPDVLTWFYERLAPTPNLHYRWHQTI